MIEQILTFISQISTPGFFVTAELSKEDIIFPTALEHFIKEKLQLIQQGNKGRKYVYQEKGWRIILTYFPTNEVVDEKYALKNKVIFKYS